MIQRVASPILVGREEELSALEDALLAAHRGEGRLIAVAGEAGLGKTRLVTELSRRAEKLGERVLWGSCAETELSLPYLPFIEAIGNYLASVDTERIGRDLGPARRDLAQLFPQLGESPVGDSVVDAGLAKARLFEAIAALLSIPAREGGLLLVVDDAHWADSSTRELLDHLTRRLPTMRALVVVTYRSDEIERRHPLLPLLQTWRRSKLAETVKLEPLSRDDVAEMIGAIFDEREVSAELRDLIFERSEGNPFVLEEMLKESVERGDIYRTASGWDRKPIEVFGIPDSVRDTVLLRLSRIDPRNVEILECASVLGRSFDSPTLQLVAERGGKAIDEALAEATSKQLIEEDPHRRGRFRWRHALTQEAIYNDILVTRRESSHARAAEALAGTARAVERAHHLLDAGRFADAVPECLRAAEEAEAAVAYSDAITLYERALPHITDPHERAEVLCRLGVDYAWDERIGASLKALTDGVAALEEAGDELRAAHFRLWLGRTQWTALRGDLAVEEFERARVVLERHGPSADLAMAHLRLAQQLLFNLDDQGCLEGCERAYAIAESVGADLERVWALTFIGAALTGLGEIERGNEATERAFEEATARRFYFVARNSQWNDCWIRVHMMIPGAELCAARLLSEELSFGWTGWSLIARSYVRRAKGDLAGALADADEALGRMRENPKTSWRAIVQACEVLSELGRAAEALERLPDPSEQVDAQDLTYQGPAQIRTRMVLGRLDEAVAFAMQIHQQRHLLANTRETLAVAGEAFVATGMLDEARDLIAAGRSHPTPAGIPWQQELEARVALATGDASGGVELLRPAIEEAERCGFPLAATRMRVVLGRALSAAGDGASALEAFRRVARDTDQMGAGLLGNEARAEAAALGADLPAAPLVVDEKPVAVGERMITSLFADIRGYTAMASSTSPEVLVDRLTALYRWGKAEVERNRGMIDKFAGDAVMAAFNVDGSSVDHPLQALKAALGLRDKAALMDLPIGLGIAAGPAVVGRPLEGANPVTLGSSVNLAARLQSAASSGEVMLSEDVYRRTENWLTERGLKAEREELELKGFDTKQVAYRIQAPTTVANG